MATPLVTLTTDFGLSDQYVGVMKGVILGICPRAQIVDISHNVKPFQIAEAAYVIAQAYREFPRKTVHVVVVDPGVGTSRRPLLMEAAEQYFVAPDNGALAMVYAREKCKVRVISNHKYFRQPVSATFHGRDIFAPVAAHVAAGERPSRMGRIIEDYVRSGFERPQRTGEQTWTGQVLHIDRFGNIVTNFRATDFPALKNFSLILGSHQVRVLARNYAQCGAGELFAIEGSSGYLEISVNQGSVAERIGCQSGAVVEMTLG